MRFQTTLQLAGKTATGFEVPPEIVEALGSKRAAVRVTIRGYTYRSTIAARGDRYLVGVSAENRAGADVAAGDVVDIEIELDTAPREVTVPPELAAALDREPAARQLFDSLSYSKRTAFASPIERAKAAETRQRHIDRALGALREGRTQP